MAPRPRTSRTVLVLSGALVGLGFLGAGAWIALAPRRPATRPAALTTPGTSTSAPEPQTPARPASPRAVEAPAPAAEPTIERETQPEPETESAGPQATTQPAPKPAAAPSAALAVLREAVERPAAGSLRPLIEKALGRARWELQFALDAGGDADELAELIADPRWHGFLGQAGFARLEAALPVSLRQELDPRLAAARATAGRFEAALATSERAFAAGDMAAVRAAFPADHPDALDPWFRAARQVLTAGPEMAQADSDRAPEAARGAQVLTVEAGVDRTLPGSTVATPPVSPWQERFAALEKQLRRAGARDRAELQTQLREVVQESVVAGSASWEACDAVLAFFDGRPAAQKLLPELHTLLEGLHREWFQGAFERATGPAGFQALVTWCREHEHPEWAARVTPLLRLCAAAGPQEKARANRAKGIAAAGEFQREREAQLVDGLRDLLGWMRERACAPAPLRAELEQLFERALPGAAGDGLRAELAAIRAQDVDPAQERQARAKLQRLVGQVTSRLLKAVDTCIDAGEPGLGFDLLQQLLRIDPEHEKAHRGLGHVQADGRWMRRFEAQRWAAGWAWDSRRGWIRRADRARWEAGECCDPTTGAWTAQADADRRHADPQDPWVIETEHFLLRSTATLERATAVAERMEAFYLAMFSRYDLFFADRGGAALVFGVSANPRKHAVWFYRDRQEYLSCAQAPAKTAGIYDPARQCAFFYDAGEDWSTLQHELTHEILDETSPGLSGQLAWLVEGAAVYLQDARLCAGAIVLPDVEGRPDVLAHARALRQGEEVKVSEVLALDQGQWNEVSTGRHYAAAGALVYFLCHADGGRYRADLVHMLKETYQGHKVSVSEATGLSPEALQALEEHFYAAR